MSMLQLVTAMGWLIATLFSVRTAANLHMSVPSCLPYSLLMMVAVYKATEATCTSINALTILYFDCYTSMMQSLTWLVMKDCMHI